MNTGEYPDSLHQILGHPGERWLEERLYVKSGLKFGRTLTPKPAWFPDSSVNMTQIHSFLKFTNA